MPRYRLRVSSESRLLLMTIAVAAGALLLLARLRFPEPPPVTTVAAAPLEKLAARAAYDDLAATIGRLEQTIAPSLIVLRTRPRAPAMPVRITDLLATDTSPADIRHVPALRLDSDAAVARFADDEEIDGIEGAEDAGVAALGGVDPVQHLAWIRAPAGVARQLTLKPLAELSTPTYVVAIEGTYAGVTARPVFIGHAERFGSPRWSRPLLPLGGVPVTPGALMFALDGDFLGITVVESGALAIASAFDVLDTARHLHDTPGRRPVSIGVALQPLTDELKAATGATAGAIVSDVDEQGPAAGVLEVGDVITEFNGRPVTAADALLLSIAESSPGDVIRLAIMRSGTPRDVTFVGGRLQSPAPAAGDGTIAFVTVPGQGARVVTVPSGSTFASIGIAPDDLITRAGDIDHPTAPDVHRLMAAPGEVPLLLAIRRGARQRVVALPRNAAALR